MFSNELHKFEVIPITRKAGFKENEKLENRLKREIAGHSLYV